MPSPRKADVVNASSVFWWYCRRHPGSDSKTHRPGLVGGTVVFRGVGSKSQYMGTGCVKGLSAGPTCVFRSTSWPCSDIGPRSSFCPVCDALLHERVTKTLGRGGGHILPVLVWDASKRSLPQTKVTGPVGTVSAGIYGRGRA